MTTALVTHPTCLEHDTGPYHPETSEWLRAVLAALEAEEFAGLLWEEAPCASLEQLVRVHPREYVEAILAIQPDLGQPVQLDSDTVMGAGSAEAAFRAAGGAVQAGRRGDGRAGTLRLRRGSSARPSCGTATTDGFLPVQQRSRRALHARVRWSIKRVAVVDFDVHHGNGTQAVFAADPNLFYASSHQSPSYPGTREPWERGVADNIINTPLHPRDGGAAFRDAWSGTILPLLDRFAPGLLIISAGFDAHIADPMADLRLETEDFAWITDQLVALAKCHCGGRVVSIMEGGYDLNALAACAAVHVRGLMRA